MEEILLEHGEQELVYLLSKLEIVMIAIIVVSALVLIPRNGGKKKLDPRMITVLCGIFWGIIGTIAYPDIYFSKDGIAWLIVDITFATAIIHFREYILKRRNRKKS